MYGTTFSGGTHSSGIVFKLSPKSGGGWTEKILHNFDPVFNFGSTDGSNPAAGLIFDSSGNLYGATVYGGDFGGGVAFKLAPSGTLDGDGVVPFQSHVLSTFLVYSGLVFDNSGNLYGATLVGGFSGSVFELMPTLSGYWNSVTLYNFDSTHGSGPANGSLIFDSAGNLYGATQNGGTNKVGVIFKITP